MEVACLFAGAISMAAGSMVWQGKEDDVRVQPETNELGGMILLGSCPLSLST